MNQLPSNDPSAPPVPSRSLFDGFVCSPESFCEAFDASSKPRGHWQPLIQAVDAMGTQLLNQRQDRATRMRHEDGATYNPFDESTRRGIPWALEVIPLPITAGEWAHLEAGMVQRARLLEQILADVYGPQALLKGGHLPAELVFANPNFQRGCHGVQPAGNRFLSYYAADLYRGTDGQFRVLRDFGANPTGLGYALENRIVISRIFPQLYHQTQIRRLAPFFHTFQQSVDHSAAMQKEDVGTVLLSPGPASRIYFEHALLSRYLGYPLVEGQDLTVRNGRVFLKKLAGLEPVGAILRHISDPDSDPFALRRQAGIGTAGIIQAMRERQVHLVNPVGSGFVDTPALTLFLPALCQQVLGESLRLANHPAWWCGDPEGLNHAQANLDRLRMENALDRGVRVGKGSAMVADLQAAPHEFMALGPLDPAVVPAWSPDGVRLRRTFMRVFVCATQTGFAVMPGGLALTAPDVDTLVGGLPEDLQSKDVWVASDRPVETFSMLSGLQTVPAFQRGSDLPSRVADHLLWLGRYLERAEGLIRLLRSIYRRLAGESRPADIPELPFLLDLLRADGIVPPAAEDTGPIPRYRELAAQLGDALNRQDRPESVAAVIKRVQEAARNVRDRLSLDSWRVINRLEVFADDPAGEPLDRLNDALFTLSAFSGLAMESMTRGLGWRFMDMGRRMERGMNQCALIRVGLSGICNPSSSTLAAVLEVFDSIMTYRARYRTVFQPAPVLDLLILDDSNPKSLAFQCVQLAVHADCLPVPPDPSTATPETQLAREMSAMIDRMDLTGLHGDDPEAAMADLAGRLETMRAHLKAFGQQISAHYLARVPTTPHYSIIPGGPRP